MLTLPIRRKWFDMIVLGAKTVEYREPSEYWITRLRHEGLAQDVLPDYRGLRLRLRAGYAKHSPSAIIVLEKIDKGCGYESLGAEPGKEYLRLHIAKVEEVSEDE